MAGSSSMSVLTSAPDPASGSFCRSSGYRGWNAVTSRSGSDCTPAITLSRSWISRDRYSGNSRERGAL
eukprot:CAMPEP_0205918962 /NCGR_PEP_ID=MMETSP1325-20131115/10129_1 /ASSEMBLY_ACC=CAM_ASM_000708 /TAXON_ID=236786 /ORGANISM="Florenciella sp., Strain RCC1007" /LENGTH=67 /DNA_ID=CAMNT_0053286535 /DNA_START=106 /DNA_END=306 /DNA_ORIENTATION=+